jgi:conjugative relaxase-like TrwC/TraI family protein
VLSVAKLRVGAEAYQLTGVAQSLDDYYSSAGEAAGWWAGLGAERLGLDGEVSGDDLRAVLAGIRPGTGGLTPNGETIHPHPRRVPGFDLTFKAPKSVSVLYAVSDDPRVQGAIIEAGEAALRQTLAWVEREVMAVRRGTGNERFLADLAAKDPAAAEHARIRTERGAELVAAVFRHRTSRSGDPLLHWHVLVPNMVRGTDGRWSAFVHPDLYRMGRAAGEVFQATLRDELSRSLGLQWRPGRHVGEVAGVPQAVCDGFSKRSAEIDAWLAEHGRGHDPTSRQEAVLATRRGKEELEGERFDTRWKLEGTELGFGPDHAEALITGLHLDTPDPHREVWRLPEVSFEPDGTPYTHDRIVSAEEWIDDLLTRDLTVKDATFTRAELYQAVAHRLGDGATVTTIDRIANHVIASHRVLPIHEPGTMSGAERWTSQAMAATERRLLDTFAERASRIPVPAETIGTVLATHPNLGADQRLAVEVLAGSSDPVSVLIGPAGTGKTYTLAVVREAFEAAGYRLIGAAPSARAAAELGVDAGMDTHTLHALTRSWDHGLDLPDAKSVLVVDETAMAATRDLEPLVHRTIAARGRVVLVGDHRQLPEIGPGGALAAATTHVRAVAELSVNRRQREPWEQAALAELRAGSVPAAVAAYRDHDRVIVAADHEEMLTIAVDRYLELLRSGRRPVLMAGTNDTVARLNAAVRHRLAQDCRLVLDDVCGVSHGHDLVRGERVVLRHNQRITQPDGTTARVRNSDAATVLDARPGGGIVVRRDLDGATIALDAGYLAAGWVDHGYAVTAHRAQGGTWDTAIAVGVDGLYREAAYVQLSRGRDANLLVIPAAQMAQVDAELTRHDHGLPLAGDEPPETFEDLVDRLETSRANLMALTRDPDADRIAQLAEVATLPELTARADTCHRVERLATQTIGIDPRTLAAAVERAQRTARHVQIGQAVMAYDRHNIGHAIDIDDINGTIGVQFISAEGHEATRHLPWTELEFVDPLGPERVLPEPAEHRLDTLVASCGATLEHWRMVARDHGVEPNEGRRSHRAGQLLIDRAAADLTAEPPPWLDRSLGPRPDAPHHAGIWDTAVRTIAEHRLQHLTPDHVDGIGQRPLQPDRRDAWDIASAQLLRARTQLEAGQALATETWPRLRTSDELLDRRQELDGILAAAPPDQRDLIDRLRHGDQLSLLDTTAALEAALETQGARRDWILAQWPHVVEYAEISAAIDNGAHAPDLATVRGDLILNAVSPALRSAAGRSDAWLDRALCTIDLSSGIRRDSMVFLERLAEYRQTWGIVDESVIGHLPTSPRQAAALQALIEQNPRLVDDPTHLSLATDAVPEPTPPDLASVDLTYPDLPGLF